MSVYLFLVRLPVHWTKNWRPLQTKNKQFILVPVNGSCAVTSPIWSVMSSWSRPARRTVFKWNKTSSLKLTKIKSSSLRLSAWCCFPVRVYGLFEDAAHVWGEEGCFFSFFFTAALSGGCSNVVKIPDKCANEFVCSSVQDLTRLAGLAELTPAPRLCMSWMKALGECACVGVCVRVCG